MLMRYFVVGHHSYGELAAITGQSVTILATVILQGDLASHSAGMQGRLSK